MTWELQTERPWSANLVGELQEELLLQLAPILEFQGGYGIRKII